MNVDQIISQLTEMAISYGPKLLGAIIVWIAGNWIIKLLTKKFGQMLERRNTDKSLKPFLKGIISAALKALLVVTVLSMVGIEMTSFIAILGAAGLAIGMALSGTLQNFAGGVMLITFKPFKVGDYIDAQGYSGTVDEIQIFNTVLKTPDNKTIIIPNGGLSTSAMTNYSAEKIRRVDWTVGVGYGENSSKTEQVIRDLCKNDPRILDDPALFVGVSELADSSVNYAVRAWVNAEDYWDVFFDMNRKIYDTFEREGLNIPFPQMDIHVHKND